jgi:hypothetical protein
MMQLQSIITIICLVLLVVGIIIFFIIIHRKNKYTWKCTEKGCCEIVLNGDYNTQKKCLEACKNKEEYKKKVKFSQLKSEIDVNGQESVGKT